MPEQWPGPNDPNDDGNAIQGAGWACLFSGALVLAVVGLVVLFQWWL